MSIYASDPDSRPDEDYEPGTLGHLVAGAKGRLLDPRRTPVSVTGVRAGTGFVLIRIEAFEDEGATWEIPLEQVGHFQFELDGSKATDVDVAEMELAVARFAREQTIEASATDHEQTERRIEERRAQAAEWLDRSSRFLARGDGLPDPSRRRGDPDLAGDFESWMRAQGTWDIEEQFAKVFVSNPGSGEVVKGHRIVLAELGLADYAGPIVRDPATFKGPWTRERRAEHIVVRLAFVRAVFRQLGRRQVTLWRGAASERRLNARPGRTFVSTSFAEAVARSHYEGGSPAWTHVLVRQAVPIDRLFITYHETAAMNTIFLEAEAVVLARPGDGWP